MNDTEPVGPVPDYEYVTYIGATAEQVWDALTDPEKTGRFWGHAQVSDWKTGSRVEHVRTDGSGIADAAGTVHEVDAPHRLSFGFGDPAGADRPLAEQSLVTFQIEQFRDIVKLSITQTRIPTAADRAAVAEGWPTVFANLKTLLETGDVLPTPPWEFHSVQRAAQLLQHDEQ